MNGNQHRVIGAAAGAIFTVAKYIIKKEVDSETKFSWGELLLNSGIGLLLATLPDLLEPACNPHHRKFFHSLASAGLIGYGAFGKHTKNMDEDFTKLIQAMALSYLLHLGADATTKKSLPILHPKIL